MLHRVINSASCFLALFPLTLSTLHLQTASQLEKEHTISSCSNAKLVALTSGRAKNSSWQIVTSAATRHEDDGDDLVPTNSRYREGGCENAPNTGWWNLVWVPVLLAETVPEQQQCCKKTGLAMYPPLKLLHVPPRVLQFPSPECDGW